MVAVRGYCVDVGGKKGQSRSSLLPLQSVYFSDKTPSFGLHCQSFKRISAIKPLVGIASAPQFELVAVALFSQTGPRTSNAEAGTWC